MIDIQLVRRDPERVRAAVAILQRGGHEWLEPGPCAEEDILRVHTPVLLDAVKRGEFSDADTPYLPLAIDGNAYSPFGPVFARCSRPGPRSCTTAPGTAAAEGSVTVPRSADPCAHAPVCSAISNNTRIIESSSAD